MRLNLRNMLFSASSVSELRHAALVSEVSHALLQWVKSNPHTPNSDSGVLIGGLALSFYSKPRYTTDIDLLFLSSDIAVPEGFKRNRPSAFTEKQTHVEVEIVTPASVGIPVSVARKVVETAHVVDGLRIASKEALVVLKLFGADTPKRKHKDLADIQALLETGDVDVSDWSLSDDHKKTLDELRHM